MDFYNVLFLWTAEIILFIVTFGRYRPKFEGEFNNSTGEYIGIKGIRILLWIIGLIFWIVAGFVLWILYVSYILGG